MAKHGNTINVYKNKTEELYSNILTAILNFPCDNYSIFKSFLKLADRASGNSLNIFSALPVHSPTISAEDHKVDISIKDDNYRIVIENKINSARDLSRQLARYIDGSVHGAHYFEKDIYVIYISDNKKDPDRHSWIRLDKKLIATDYKYDFRQRFANISRHEICEWLETEVLDLCKNDSEIYEFTDISLKYFKKEISKEVFKNYKFDRKNNNYDNATNIMEIINTWGKMLECHYSKDVISGIDLTDSKIDVIFKLFSIQNNRSYKFGCRMEIYKKWDRYEQTFIRYGIYKIDDIPTFSKDFLSSLFDLFFKIDRYYDRYNKNFQILENSGEYLAFRDVQLWHCNDYEFQFALKYYLMDLIDKIIMFIIAPLQTGLFIFNENPNDFGKQSPSK